MPVPGDQPAHSLPTELEAKVYAACFQTSPAAALQALQERHHGHQTAIAMLAVKVLRANGLVHDLRTHATADGPPVGVDGVVTASPAHIANYRIEREIGQGGFGVVYLAQQTGPLPRQVALKVMRSDVASAEVLERFAAERAIGRDSCLADPPIAICPEVCAGRCREGAPEHANHLPVR